MTRHARRFAAVFLAVLAAAVLVAACSTADPAPTATEPSPAQEEDAASPPDDEGAEDEPEVEPEPVPDEDTEAEEPAEPEPEPLDPLEGLALEVVAEGLTDPVDVTTAPGDDRLFVVERTGAIRAVSDGEVADEPFGDLTENVNANGIEQGLLGMAFHPDYPDDPRVFVYHTRADNNNVLVAYTVSEEDRLDPESRSVLVTVEKEPDKVRHNGGAVLFGPDGLLYVGVGDAARASVNGQDPSTLPGSILRLDVDDGDPYGIPPDNPFADGVDGAPEVWWYGLRNPWRFSIDAESGLAYVADVGQQDVEEVNVAPVAEPGLNFGWPLFEGTERFYEGEPATSVTDPVVEVGHDDTDEGCSITGGEVYRGAAIPELAGHYFYADWCHGWIRSFRYDDGDVDDEQDWSDQLETEMVSGFAVDRDGELLVVDYAAATVSRVVAVR